MKQLLFTFTAVYFAIWLEVALSNFNFVLPVLLLQLFYITVVRKWRWGLLTAFISCAVLDSLLGYMSLPSAVAIIIFASFWRSIGDCSRLELQFLPVIFAMLIAMLLLFVTIYLRYGGAIEWLRWSMQFAFSVIVTAIIAPAYFRAHDFLAIKLDILTYAAVQREEMYSAAD
jgi:hypothetical protein